jgi:GTP-binding protein EngB required for normal cell division
VTRTLDERLAALAEAGRLAEGRLDPELVARLQDVTAKSGHRIGHGVELTVVALAGPTGAGKSLLFNALTGTDLASVGRRRPTTSVAQAAAWGDGADPLLDWLGIARRHRLESDGLGGLVLLDLPDFDSVALTHRLEVDRIIELADLVVWVVEPQKYADAALHEGYLRPLASHAAAMALVLNQADLLSAADVRAWRDDAQQLLDDNGLRALPLVLVSAHTGDGLEDLRRLLEERVAARTAAVVRLGADVNTAAAELAAACGRGRGGVRGEDRKRVVAALEEAAGVPGIVQAVNAAHRRRGALVAGWPFFRWIRRLRPDPLRRLRLPDSPAPAVRTSLPPPTDVQRAQIATAARTLADHAANGLPSPWPTLVRTAATGNDERVADRLDRAVARADLHMARPRWWSVAGWLQRPLAAAVLLGLLWLLALAVLGYLRVDDIVPVPEIGGVPVPTWLAAGGAAAGIALALLARLVNGLSARRRSRQAGRSLRRRVEKVADELVIAPIEAELHAHSQLCAALAIAESH